jgi:hypothetical protein
MTTDTKKLRELLAEVTDSALPWSTPGCSLYDADDLKVADYLDPPEAELIVSAVNALPALLDEVEGLRAERDRMRGGIVEACDLLMERTHGSPARSPSHNARLKLQALLGETK